MVRTRRQSAAENKASAALPAEEDEEQEEEEEEEKKENQAAAAAAADADAGDSDSDSDGDGQGSERRQTGGADGMTEYERKRLENIQRNLDFMRSMGVSTAKIAARTATSVGGAGRAPKASPTQRGIPTKRGTRAGAPAAPVRKSRRLEGKVADTLADTKLLPSASELRWLKRQEEPRRLGAKLDAEALNVDGAQLLASILSDEPRAEREEDLAVDASGVDVVSYALHESDVVKAVEERVYSLAFAPRSDRVVVACGDKRGNLALWNADAPESDASVVAMYRPHTLPATQLHFKPSDAAKLLSSSFDGTVREFDLKAATFTELFATPDHTGITSMAVGAQPDVFLLSGDDGHVWSLDTRQARTKHAAYVVHEKKVQTVHQHPCIDFCFATASLDRTVCLWDARKLSTATTTENSPLATMPHHRSVNCAYFSPTGAHLVTVGQEDYIHVYDTHDATHLTTRDVQPTLRIPHNNQTGRWLTKLHAAWNPKRPDEYVIGCMQQPRRLQIFHAARKSPIQELTSEFFGSVHSINVFHPTLQLIAGGNSSGRLCLWRGVKSEANSAVKAE